MEEQAYRIRGMSLRAEDKRAWGRGRSKLAGDGGQARSWEEVLATMVGDVILRVRRDGG